MNSRYKRLRCFSLFHKCADVECDAAEEFLTRSDCRSRGHPSPLTLLSTDLSAPVVAIATAYADNSVSLVRAASARSASGYPATPKPTMIPAATGETYE